MISTVLQIRLISILTDHYNYSKDIDIFKLSLAYCMDIITATIFGLPCSTNLLHDLDYREWLFAKFNDYFVGHRFWLNNVPELTACLQNIGLDPAKLRYYRAQRELEEWCLTLVRAAENLITLNAFKNDTILGVKSTVFEKLWLAIKEDAKTNWEFFANLRSLYSADNKCLEMASKCLDHLLASRNDFGKSNSTVLHISCIFLLTNCHLGITLSSIFHKIL